MTLASLNFIIIILDIVVVGAFIFVLSQALKFRQPFTLFTTPPKKTLTLRDAVLKERWQGIMAKANPQSIESLKVAVIEADKMVDDVLKRLGLGGQHMADRLAQMDQDEFSTLKRLWNAHRFRNNLVHTPDFEVNADRIQKILGDYGAFLKEVGVL